MSLPGPWWPCPLRRAGTAWRVNRPRTMVNFFRDPPLPWVHFFGWPRSLTARCRSPDRSFSALTVFTVASSSGTSSCAATNFISSGFASGGVRQLDGSPQRERCQRGNSQDYNYWTSIQRGIPWKKKTKRKPTDNTDKRGKKPTTSTTGATDPQLQSKPEVPTLNFLAPPRSTEMEADQGDDADYTTEHQQYQTPSSQAGRLLPIALTSKVNLIQL
jgi:hypothetical protein